MDLAKIVSGSTKEIEMPEPVCSACFPLAGVKWSPP